MKIKSVEIYRDGGSKKIETDQGTFIVLSQTYGALGGKVVTDWPNNGGKLIANQALAKSVKSLGDAFYDGMIYQQHLMVHK